jgi:hypothetical protein
MLYVGGKIKGSILFYSIIFYSILGKEMLIPKKEGIV